MKKDFYAILGVGKNASEEEIKKAYRKLAHQHHPDKGGGDEAKFKEINEAYQALSDKQKRAQYDTYGDAYERAGAGHGQPGGAGSGGFQWDFSGGNAEGFSDIFEDFFGFGGGRKQGGARVERGEDIRVSLELTLEDVAFGFEKEISLKRDKACARCKGSGADAGAKIVSCVQCKGSGHVQRQYKTVFGTIAQNAVCQDCRGKGTVPEKKCSVCHGAGIVHETDTFTINIPKGVDDGEAVRITGKGNAPLGGGTAGDLYTHIALKRHAVFERRGADLYMHKTITFSQAALGDKVEISTLYGLVYLKIPVGVQSGSLIKIGDKGMPKKSGFGKGDLLVRVEVKTPEKLSRRQKELLEELKKEGI